MLKIAWRNLWRNRTRTLIVVSAIAFTYALLLISFGLGDSAYGKLMDSALRVAGGDLLIHADGYWDSRGSDLVISDPDEIVRQLASNPDVDVVHRRVIVQGLVRSPRGNAMVQLSGVDRDNELTLTSWEDQITLGTFLAGDESDPLVLGSAAVDDLELEIGDRVVLTATDPDGEVVSALFHLSGILHTGIAEMDASIAFTTVEAAQDALGMGDALTQIGLDLVDGADRHVVRDALQSSAVFSGAVLELYTWDEAMPEMMAYLEIDRNFNIIYQIVILIIVGFGIANTFMMAVLERIRELGLLGALGLGPAQVARLVVVEAAVLGAFSLVVGFSIAFGVHLYLAQHGIDLAELYDMNVEIGGISMSDTVIRTEIDPTLWVKSTIGVFFLVLISCIYPAWRAARLEPAQAMRTFQ